MKERLLHGWNFVRVVYLIMGASMIGFSISEKMWAGILFGAYFAAMGLFAFGCAGGNCYTAPRRQTPVTGKDTNVVFEEVK